MNRFCRRVGRSFLGVRNGTSPNCVVHNQVAIGLQKAEQAVHVVRVVHLVRVDVAEVELAMIAAVVEQLVQSCDSRANPQVDLVRHTCRLPEGFAYVGVLLRNVTCDELATFRKPTGQAQSRVARENSDLDASTSPSQFNHHLHPLTLVRRRQHAREPRHSLHCRLAQLQLDLAYSIHVGAEVLKNFM